MKVTGKKSLSNFIEICLKIVFIIGIIIYLTLPFLLNQYIKYFNPVLNYTAALVMLYTSGIPALVIVWEFIKMFGTLKKDKPFILENVKCLRVVSLCS